LRLGREQEKPMRRQTRFQTTKPSSNTHGHRMLALHAVACLVIVVLVTLVFAAAEASLPVGQQLSTIESKLAMDRALPR
jgi:hypothetical protein